MTITHDVLALPLVPDEPQAALAFLSAPGTYMVPKSDMPSRDNQTVRSDFRYMNPSQPGETVDVTVSRTEKPNDTFRNTITETWQAVDTSDVTDISKKQPLQVVIGVNHGDTVTVAEIGRAIAASVASLIGPFDPTTGEPQYAALTRLCLGTTHIWV